ncbi:hypothetical protein SABR111722_06705 [Saccharibacillus brassicae]
MIVVNRLRTYLTTEQQPFVLPVLDGYGLA